jgi:CheY-like chemotaxis protein
MSHEIRTPMNAIVGMTELALRDDNLTASAREHILTVRQAGSNLLSIINDILDLSKIESGKLEIIPAGYSFSSLINDVISIIRMRIIDTPIRFAVKVDSAIPATLIGDETRIRQILINVLGNAVKYTEKGFVSLSAYSEFGENNTVNIVMEITDSGIGIKQEDIKNLFDVFAQFDSQRNKRIEGVGLGLAITHNLVKIMGGSIGVMSEYGTGSTFTITLPQKYCTQAPLAAVKDPQEKNVLLIYERREVYADSIAFSIENLGAKCTVVSDDSNLFEKLKNHSYTYLFIAMPLFEKNKEIISKYANKAKIVILTEFGEEIHDDSISILAMPAYCVSIANILNNKFSNLSYNNGKEQIAGFTAPDAKVLIVDDINTNLKVAQGLLLPYNMKITLCKSGKEAIEKLKADCYDLVFMDHKMPEMDGVEATQIIRAMEGDYFQNLPIIALTANAILGTREYFMENGFNDFISKPVDTVQLNVVLEKWIPKKKKEAALIHNGNGAIKERNGSADIVIEGIDIEKGISRFSGNTDEYFETLTLFCSDGLEKIQELKSCLEKDDLSLYTIYVHALKSAAANIGADKLSETAKFLEDAGKQENLEIIEAHNGRFLEELEACIGRIHSAVSVYNKTIDKENESFDKESLKRELAKLNAAIDTLDAGVMNRTIDRMRKYTQVEGIGSIISAISEKILMADYDEAAALIKTLVQELESA